MHEYFTESKERFATKDFMKEHLKLKKKTHFTESKGQFQYSVDVKSHEINLQAFLLKVKINVQHFINDKGHENILLEHFVKKKELFITLLSLTMTIYRILIM